jgi:hypothetical protein
MHTTIRHCQYTENLFLQSSPSQFLRPPRDQLYSRVTNFTVILLNRRKTISNHPHRLFFPTHLFILLLCFISKAPIFISNPNHLFFKFQTYSSKSPNFFFKPYFLQIPKLINHILEMDLVLCSVNVFYFLATKFGLMLVCGAIDLFRMFSIRGFWKQYHCFLCCVVLKT